MVSYNTTRHFTTWLSNVNASLVVTSYKKHQLYSIGRTPTGEITMWFTDLARPMGISYKNGSLWCSNVGNLIKFENKGSMVDPTHGTFDANFLPKRGIFNGDVDIHDLCETDNGDIFYCSALFSCICRPSLTKTFEVYWKPPWIDRLAAEDRCHLNGLCLINNVPRVVTAACQSNDAGGWRDIKGKGVVYDIVEEKLLCDGLWNPHSPRWHNDKLWILESGTGHFGYVENGQFHKKAFIPTFLRGMNMIQHFAVICGSLDRHDNSFGELPLGKELESRGLKSKCGIWIVNLNTFDILHTLTFDDNVSELYDVAIVPNCVRPKIIQLNDETLLNQFFL